MKVDWGIVGALVAVMAGIASLIYGMATERILFICIPALGVAVVGTVTVVRGWLFDRKVEKASKEWQRIAEEFNAKSRK